MRTTFFAVAMGFAAAAAAQTAPLPPAPERPVVGHIGRYLDSTANAERLTFPRVARAKMLRIAPERDRIYMIMGETVFAAQRLSTFADRVAVEPLQTAPGTPPFGGETFLALEKSFDASAPGSGWPANSHAGALRLYNFDWDDRGLDYLAFSSYWAIVDDATFAPVTVQTDAAFSPLRITAFRNGASYFVLVTSIEETRLYDVTNPVAIVLVRTERAFYGALARSDDGRIAVIRGGALEIHTGSTLAANTPPLFTLGNGFVDVVTDGANYYALQDMEGELPDFLHVFRRTEAGYLDLPREAQAWLLPQIAVGGEYLTVLGGAPGQAETYLVYSISEAGLTLLNDTYFGWDSWIGTRRTYIAQPVNFDGRRLLITASGGLGEVYLLAPPRRRSIRN